MLPLHILHCNAKDIPQWHHSITKTKKVLKLPSPPPENKKKIHEEKVIHFFFFCFFGGLFFPQDIKTFPAIATDMLLSTITYYLPCQNRQTNKTKQQQQKTPKTSLLSLFHGI